MQTHITLSNKLKMPSIGLGTWTLQDTSGQEVIEHALEIGYRHIDTADWYRNHSIVGKAIKNSGVKREDIFLVTKVYPPLGEQKVLDSGKRFLNELQTNYIDLLLIHWPDGDTPISETLDSLNELKKKGVTKSIGVSNFEISDLKEALKTGVEIVNNQIEFHPHLQPNDVVKFCKKNNISVTAYSPLGQGKSTRDKIIKQIAEKYDKSPSQIILNWILQKNIIVIPKTSEEGHIKENLQSGDWKMEKEDLEKINNL